MWQQILGHMAPLEWFAPRARVRIQSFRWQLKSQRSPERTTMWPKFPCQRSACSVSCGDDWRRDGHLECPSPDTPFILFFCLQMCPRPVEVWICRTWEQMGCGQRKNSISISKSLRQSSSVRIYNLQGPDHERVRGLNEQQYHGGGVHEETGRHCFLSVVWSHTGNTLAEHFTIFLTARYILRKKNVLSDQLCHLNQLLPIEWSLFPQGFQDICKELGCHLIDLFTTRANAKLQLYVSSFQSHSLKGGHLPAQLGHSHSLCLTSVCSSKTDPVENYDLLELFYGFVTPL